MSKIKTSTLILLATMCLIADDAVIKKLFQRMPAEILGWSKNSACQLYDGNSLYDYIDGNAELYLSYGFKKLLSGKYSRSGQPEIMVDVFDMKTSYNAFGIFSHSREILDNSIGQGSEYSGGLLVFWKGKYYFSLLVFPETPEAKEAVLSLGKQIADLIVEKGNLPSILELLPEKGLIEPSIRYFHHYIWLNSHYFISNDNILHIDPSTEVVLAAYQHEKIRYFLLLVSYPDKKSCAAAHADFLKHYLPDNRNGIKQIEDGRWTGCRVEGKRFWIVLNANEEKDVLNILDSAIRK